jgi:fatty acid desaturase
MRLKKRLILYCLSLVSLGLMALPAVVIVTLGWVHDWRNNANAYLVLVVIYVVWMPAVTFSMVAILDRLGIHYAVRDRPARPTRKERRRARAGLRYLAGQEEARRAAAQSRAATKPRDPGAGEE